MQKASELDLMDAVKRALEAAFQLEGRFGSEGVKSENLEYLTSQCMKLLVKRFIITPPAIVTANSESDHG